MHRYSQQHRSNLDIPFADATLPTWYGHGYKSSLSLPRLASHQNVPNPPRKLMIWDRDYQGIHSTRMWQPQQKTSNSTTPAVVASGVISSNLNPSSSTFSSATASSTSSARLPQPTSGASGLVYGIGQPHNSYSRDDC